MISDFTPPEVRRITAHCKREKISVSKFLADVARNEVYRASKEPSREEVITITIRVPAEQNAKIKMFAHRQNKTYKQFLIDLLLPTIRKAKTYYTAKTQSLRYYLSAEDHEMILKFLKSKNLSARTYVSYLALQALKSDKAQTRRSK